jgi:hypothetical protein
MQRSIRHGYRSHSAEVAEQFPTACVSTGYAKPWSDVGMWKLIRRAATWVRGFGQQLCKRLAPHTDANATLGLAVDAARSRRDLLVENAMLRHQIVVLRRRSPRSRLTRLDRFRLLLGAAILPGWRQAIAVVQPDTILGWHRRGFGLFWRRKCRSATTSPIVVTAIDLIRDMAARNRLWGAERVRGELLKLGSRS